MKKYYIGLIVLFAISLGMVAFVLLQANVAKQDQATLTAADSAAVKINSYVDKHGKAPSSLSQAGVKDAPKTITYNKKSDTSYTFCATYRADSSGTSLSSANVMSLGLSGLSPESTSYDYDSSLSSYSLYIDPNHKKGENCQTVEVYSYDYPGNTYENSCLQYFTAAQCNGPADSLYSDQENLPDGYEYNVQ